MHPDGHTSENNDSTTVDSMQARQPNARVMEKLTRDRNDIVPETLMAQNNLNQGVMEKLIRDRNDNVPEEPVVQSNLNQCNIEEIPLSGTEIEMVGFDNESIHLEIENELLNPCLSFTHLPSICFMCNSKGVLRTRII